MEYELLLFLLSAGMGAVLCLCYEFLAALRNIIPHSRTAAAVEDLDLLDGSRDFYFYGYLQNQPGDIKVFFVFR